MSQDQTEILTEYSPSFRRIFLTGIYGYISPSGVEFVVYSEQSLIDEIIKSPNLNEGKKKIKRIVECDLIIDPMQMVALHRWLGSKIKEYEHVFSGIPTPDQMNERLKSISTATNQSSNKEVDSRQK